MIRYDLRCDAGHRFEGWFPGIDAFDAQRASGDLACPCCGTSGVDRAPMAPAVARGRDRVTVDPATLLRALRRHVEATAHNVGTEFAVEARRIHEGEADRRAIYGDATPDEIADLVDDGIEIGMIPWIDTADN